MKVEQNVALDTTKEEESVTTSTEHTEESLQDDIRRVRNMRTIIPRIDIFETNADTIVLAEMPGVEENEVDITLEKNILTIRGTADQDNPSGYRWAHREYSLGKFERAFTLTDTIDQDQISAEMKNGLLRLTLPKVESAKPRKIIVKD